MGSEAGSRIFFPWLRIQALAPHYPEINQNLPVKTEPVTAGRDDTVYVRYQGQIYTVASPPAVISSVFRRRLFWHNAYFTYHFYDNSFIPCVETVNETYSKFSSIGI